MGILFISLSHVNFNKTRFIVIYITSQAPPPKNLKFQIACFSKLGSTGRVLFLMIGSFISSLHRGIKKCFKG